MAVCDTLLYQKIDKITDSVCYVILREYLNRFTNTFFLLID